MSALPSLTVLPSPSGVEPLCRVAEHTCAACCWGEALGRQVLRHRMRRQTRLFARFVGQAVPGNWRLLAFELTVRYGADLFWALPLSVPILGAWLRTWLKRRSSCAFLGFEDTAETRVGCLLHPSRWRGRDVRRRAAFAVLPGFGCGSADYLCLSAWRFGRSPWQVQQQMLRQSEGMDWFDFSRTVRYWESS